MKITVVVMHVDKYYGPQRLTPRYYWIEKRKRSTTGLQAQATGLANILSSRTNISHQRFCLFNFHPVLTQFAGQLVCPVEIALA